MIINFRGRRLAGKWACEVCHSSVRTLQICPLNDSPYDCTVCGAPLVFVPDDPPMDVERAKVLFQKLREAISR